MDSSIGPPETTTGLQFDSFLRRLKNNRPLQRRAVILLLLTTAVTVLHYSTNVHAGHYHDIYRRLYYIPIVLGGLWFGLRGGVTVAVIVSILYAPHVLFQWGHYTQLPLEQYLEMVLYNVIGFLTGLLSGREHHLREKYQAAARDLEESYDKLRRQTDLLLKTEKRIETAARLSTLGELSASLAHEIRNPLASIRLVSDNLRDLFAADDAGAEYLEILGKEVDRLNQVVSQYLSMARSQKSNQQEVDVNQAIRDVLDLIRQPASRQKVALEFRESELPNIEGDQVQLKQAFLNLALNAMQAMPDGGRLEVATSTDRDSLFITFTDNGQGLPDQDPEQIFTPFYTTREKGTGLGLAVTRRIIEAHAGTIHAQPAAPMGTRFTIRIPCEEAIS
ncbi:MAG TPA: ATP-binding protein [Desulfuromonadales bacterium]|nr:ATP-binding protein [Desulfuromonadales bacterium]